LTEEKSLSSFVYHAKTSLSGAVWYDEYAGEIEKSFGTMSYGRLGVHVSKHGWARFDISELPDDATVTGVDLLLYQYYYGGGSGLQMRARLVQDANASAWDLYGYVVSGTAISDWFYPPNGWCGWLSLPLYGLANAAVESCLTQGYIDIGIQSYAPYSSVGSAYGYTAPSNLKAHLRISFTSPSVVGNMVALDCHLSAFPCRTNEAETVSFRASFQGDTLLESAFAYLNVDGVAVDSQVVHNVTPGDTITTSLVFRAPQDEKKLQIECYTKLPIDSLLSDDTAYLDCWCFPSYTTAAVDFEPDHFSAFPPPGWVVVNGGDTSRWKLNGTIDLNAHTGRFYGICQSGQNPDDWLITDGLRPSATTADTVGLFLCSQYSGRDSVEVWALSKQDPTAKLGLLLDTLLSPLAWREFRLSLDEYPNQPVYVGVHRFRAGGPGICADDVWFSCPMGGAITEPERTVLDAPQFSMEPSVTRNAGVQFRYALRVVAELRVDVLDAAGRRRHTSVVSPTRTAGAVPLNVSDLPAGAYLVRVTFGECAQTLKFVLQR
jgi:hypothetical protein